MSRNKVIYHTTKLSPLSFSSRRRSKDILSQCCPPTRAAPAQTAPWWWWLFLGLSGTPPNPRSWPLSDVSPRNRSCRTHSGTQTQTMMISEEGAPWDGNWNWGNLSVSADAICRCRSFKYHPAGSNLQRLRGRELLHLQHWRPVETRHAPSLHHWQICPWPPHTFDLTSFCPWCAEAPLTGDLVLRCRKCSTDEHWSSLQRGAKLGETSLSSWLTRRHTSKLKEKLDLLRFFSGTNRLFVSRPGNLDINSAGN